MGFQLDGQEYREDENLTLTMPEFYAALREGKMSSTMQVNTFESFPLWSPFWQPARMCCTSVFPAA